MRPSSYRTPSGSRALPREERASTDGGSGPPEMHDMFTMKVPPWDGSTIAKNGHSNSHERLHIEARLAPTWWLLHARAHARRPCLAGLGPVASLDDSSPPLPTP